MERAKLLLLLSLGLITIWFVASWWQELRHAPRKIVDARPADRARDGSSPAAGHVGIGVLTDFLDTLGIGSFATTTSLFRFAKTVDDRLIPGTLNVGHALPTIVQALIYISIIDVDSRTLILMIAAAVLGAWLGASLVARWPRRRVRIGMGLALVGAGAILFTSLLGALPVGGDARTLAGIGLVSGVAGNFVLGVLMTIGIGLYAPCMILVSLLGMNPTAAFPIMMGSCAFLMPIAGMRFVRAESYDVKASLGLTLGGIPAVLVAAFLVRSLPLEAVRWLVLAVVGYTSFTLLRAAWSTPDS